MKSIKRAFLTGVAVLLFINGAAQTLNLYVRANRFLDKEDKCLVHIDYQVPYNNLVFLAHKGGYFAELDITVEVLNADSLVFTQTIKDNIGISNKDDANSDKTYLNRVSFYLEEEAYDFRISATDVNSLRVSERQYGINRISTESLLSDIELCSVVRPDSSAFLNKFHRGKVLYQTQPSMIFDSDVSDNVSLYFEIYSPPELLNDPGVLMLTVQKDSLIVSDDIFDFVPQRDIEGITLKIPTKGLVPGKYLGSIMASLGEQTQERDFEFFVSAPRIAQYSIFNNPEEDYQLMKYFPVNSQTPDWKTYDDQTKRTYISQMWKNWARSNNMGVQSMIDLISERVEYANERFRHFSAGWTSDMGRIHIRNGKPDEIEQDTSSDETRYVRKDYQIWKYRGSKNSVYLFVDIQMNGNYKLIYVSNDDNESSNPDYLRYLGDDFDTSLLEN